MSEEKPEGYHKGYKDGYGHGHKDGKKGHEPKKLKTGGGVDDAEHEPKPKVYNAKGSDVEKEAEERAKGGALKRKHGGKAEHERKMEGHEAKERHDRAPRKSGGSVKGSNSSPLSSASRVTNAEGRKGEFADIEEGD